MDSLTGSQREALTMFQEVTAGGRDEQASLQMLKSCGWNVEQALQLHWAAGDDDAHMGDPAAGAAGSSVGGGLGAPLLDNGPSNNSDEARGSHSGSPAAPAAGRAAAPGPARSGGIVSWIASSLWRVGATVVNVLCTFIFGPGGPQIGAPSSGAAFTRALTNSYGNLELPVFFEGTFSQALQQAQRDLKLLVVFLHSEYARDAQHFCTNILANETVRSMLGGDGFLLWGGDVARMEAHRVAQVIHARQYPCFCVLLPASVDEIRVIGSVQGNIEADRAMALLVECSEAMDSHRSEIVARTSQHVEDRHLREEQDREYQEALELDRQRAAERDLKKQEEQEAQRVVDQLRREEEEALAQIEAEHQRVEAERRSQAAALEPPGPDATASIALRLPAGQRLQRKFSPSAALRDVYTWAHCIGYLPENDGRGLEIPKRFMLKTSFPTRELTDMDKSITDLQLAGTNLIVATLDDDDES